jgi:hypothetical protein
VVLFHEAVDKYNFGNMEETFERFVRAAAKGHEESIWILSVVKDVEMEKNALKETFAKTEEPLGWYFAGMLSSGRERFDLMKKSAEGGCSWGKVAYGWNFRFGGEFVEKEEKAYVEWLEKAANQNNPSAMDWLGNWFRFDAPDKEKAVLYYHSGAELSHKGAMESLANRLRDGDGCEKDWSQAAVWSAKGDFCYVFWDLLGDAKRALESPRTNNLDCDFNQLCFALGWGLYWYVCDSDEWKEQKEEVQAFGERCLDFYCATMELQRESIFTFLLFWNRTVGVKDVGALIGKMVWEEDRSVLVKRLWKKPPIKLEW